MEPSFNKGDYDQHMKMVNATKELLNNSIVLRSIKENVDFRISKSNDKKSSEKDFHLILLLAVSLALVIVFVSFEFGFSWRIIPGLGLIGFFIVYHIITKDVIELIPSMSSQVHEDHPKPLKYLEMKVDYLLLQSLHNKRKLDLLRTFYFIFFPFLCYFFYELIIGSTPFDNTLIGLIFSVLLSTISWYLFFENDFKALRYSHNQLKDYKKLLYQHYISYTSEEE